MKINSINTNTNFNKPNFKATLKINKVIDDLYSVTDNHNKDLFQKHINLFSQVAKNDIVELKKVDNKNIEEYNLVNINKPDKKVHVCSLFKCVKGEEDNRSDFHKLQSKMEFIRESLIETMQEASKENSTMFRSLF